MPKPGLAGMETQPSQDPGLAGMQRRPGLAVNQQEQSAQKIVSNQKSPDLRPNQNQLSPNFNYMVIRQYVSYP
jgi:hypothetical protein